MLYISFGYARRQLYNTRLPNIAPRLSANILRVLVVLVSMRKHVPFCRVSLPTANVNVDYLLLRKETVLKRLVGKSLMDGRRQVINGEENVSPGRRGACLDCTFMSLRYKHDNRVVDSATQSALIPLHC